MLKALQGVRALVGTSWIDDATVLIDAGQIVSVDQAPVPLGTRTEQWPGWLALPGIVDIHGDAVERAIAPRPSSTFPIPSALVDNDLVMLASGGTAGTERLRSVWCRGVERLRTAPSSGQGS